MSRRPYLSVRPSGISSRLGEAGRGSTVGPLLFLYPADQASHPAYGGLVATLQGVDIVKDGVAAASCGKTDRGASSRPPGSLGYWFNKDAMDILLVSHHHRQGWSEYALPPAVNHLIRFHLATHYHDLACCNNKGLTRRGTPSSRPFVTGIVGLPRPLPIRFVVFNDSQTARFLFEMKFDFIMTWC